MNNHASIPTLLTTRLVLRPFTLQDLAALHQVMIEPGVLQYFPNPAPPTIERIQNLIERQLSHWSEHNFGWWAVEHPQLHELIGWCGLQYLPETDETELGFLLGKPHWGNGFATEAGLASLEYGFNTIELGTIIAIVHPDNLASQRVIDKLGFLSRQEAHYFGMVSFRYELQHQIYVQNQS